MCRAGAFHSERRGPELESPGVPTVGLQPHLMAHCIEREAAGAATSAGGTEPWLLGGLLWAMRPAPALWPHHPAPLTVPLGGSWRTLVSNCGFRTSPPELSLTSRLGSVTSGPSGLSGFPTWAELLQCRAPLGPRAPRPEETRP